MMADPAARGNQGALRLPGEMPLHVEASGEGPVVLLGHGFGGSARNFRPQVRALRDRYRVVVFDARGHARSAAPDEAAAYRPDAFASDCGRILDALAAERAVVGGLSMGAGIALRFALAHPERVRALVLAAFPPGAGASRSGGPEREWARAFADAIEREGLDAAGARFVWGADSGFDPETARWVRQGFLEHAPHALVHTLRQVLAEQPDPDELAPALERLSIPALVIVGSEDRLSRRASETVAARLPGSRLVVIEGAGHVVNLANPTAFNAALREFLDGLRN